VALLSITTQEGRPHTRGIPQVPLAVLPANHLFLMGILSIYLLHYWRCRSKIRTPDNEGAAPRRYGPGIPRRSAGTERLSGKRPFDVASQKRIAGALRSYGECYQVDTARALGSPPTCEAKTCLCQICAKAFRIIYLNSWCGMNCEVRKAAPGSARFVAR